MTTTTEKKLARAEANEIKAEDALIKAGARMAYVTEGSAKGLSALKDLQDAARRYTNAHHATGRARKAAAADSKE